VTAQSQGQSQLALLREKVRTARPKSVPPPATDRPIARVAVDISLAHLDRPFDYLVPEPMAQDAMPGCRVRVRFAGQLVDGFVLERAEATEHEGQLGRLERVVSSEVLLRPEVARLCRAVADHYAGTFADVVRLAVPPRHARAERHTPAPASSPDRPLPLVSEATWEPYVGGRALLARLSEAVAPRACWTALPGTDWTAPLAQAVLATAAAGRGSLVCVPDARDVARLDRALTEALGPGRHAVLTADLGPEARYRAFLAVARGQVRVVVGTRAAAFAPVHELGLVAIWDDGDDLYAEPRAPYPHAREVLVRRAHDAGAGALLGGYARSVEAQALVESGWCTELGASPERRRTFGAQVSVAGAAPGVPARDPAAGGRLPSEALAAVRAGLARGPVLVSVPRAGYRVALACQDCRHPARCTVCTGPLGQAGPDADPACRWCGAVAAPWRCPQCGGERLRAPVVGERRTAEELGRAFPGVRVRTSAAEAVVDRVGDQAQIVIATPGAEPVADHGYAAALLLDTGVVLRRPDLRTAEEAVRRWCNVVGLVRPAERDGRVVAVGDSSAPALQALVRADPAGFAARELAERQATRLPPAVRLATVTGPPEDVRELVDRDWPKPSQVLGPVPQDDGRARVVVRVPRSRGAALARELQLLQAARTARKAAALRVQLDPVELG